MTHILLYWNHICVLHRQEKAFLDGLTQKLLSDGIQLEVRYFGLGYPEHMSEYLARPDAVLPDLIVSADLEIFEDPDIFCKLKDDLYPVRSWMSLRSGPMLDAVERGPFLLPFLFDRLRQSADFVGISPRSLQQASKVRHLQLKVTRKQ